MNEECDCKAEFDRAELPGFAEPFNCPVCSSVWETDFEYMGCHEGLSIRRFLTHKAPTAEEG